MVGCSSATEAASGRSWIAPASAVFVSVLIHGLIAAAPLMIERRAGGRAKPLWFKVVPTRQAARAKPVVQRKVPPRPARPKPKHPPRPVAVNRPSAARETPPAPPVFGVTKESTTTGDTSFSVPLGNTVATDPANRGPVKEGEPDIAPPPPPPPPPPRPVTLRTHPHLLQEVKVPYPARARALGIEGIVQVRVLVRVDGTVEQAQIVSGPGYGLNEAARDALLRFRFRPAIGSDGKPMAHWITYRYAFEIND